MGMTEVLVYLFSQPFIWFLCFLLGVTVGLAFVKAPYDKEND